MLGFSEEIIAIQICFFQFPQQNTRAGKLTEVELDFWELVKVLGVVDRRHVDREGSWTIPGSQKLVKKSKKKQHGQHENQAKSGELGFQQ